MYSQNHHWTAQQAKLPLSPAGASLLLSPTCSDTTIHKVKPSPQEGTLKLPPHVVPGTLCAQYNLGNLPSSPRLAWGGSALLTL